MVLIFTTVLTSVNFNEKAVLASVNTRTFDGNGFQVSYTVDSQWKGAFNANITIKNTSSERIENWALRFKTENKITNIWNAVIEETSGSTYTIKNAGWNADIPVGESINFGFSADGDEVDIPENYTIPTTEKEISNEKYSVEYILDTDWKSGFGARLLITNHDSKPIENWRLEFDYKRNITEIWNAKIIEHKNDHYILENAGYNQNIAVNETIHIGFNGSGGEPTDEPINIRVNGIYINGESGGSSEEKPDNEEFVTLEDGQIEANYLYNAIYPNLLLRGLSTDNIRLADDYDEDGLTLAQEYEFDLNPFSSDTDEDGLSDADEMNKYGTDPLNPDTDGDGMSDAMEVDVGLNPKKKDSDGDGVQDNKEKVTQKVKNQSFQDISLTKSKVKPSVNITGKGDYRDKLLVNDISMNQIYKNIPGLIGSPFEFTTDEDMTFSQCTLTFTIKKSLLSKNNIEDLVIAYYSEEENTVEFLTTKYNVQKRTISAKVEHFSIYMVINAQTFYDSLITTLSTKANTAKYRVLLANGQTVQLDKNPALEDSSVDTDQDGIPDSEELKSCSIKKVYNKSKSTYENVEVWSFYSNPAKADTDGDGLKDGDDVNPTRFDIVITKSDDTCIKFNTGRVWYNITCTSFDYLDNLCQLIDGHVDHPIPLKEFKTIIECVEDNKKQSFTITELEVIGLLNNEGSKLYLQDKTDWLRENIFEKIAGRESKYYKHSGILWWEDWKEVKKGTKGGFFKGEVLSEADINFSCEIYYVSDVYSVLNSLAEIGATVIAVVLVVKATPVVVANIQGLTYYVKTFGVVQGIKMYSYLGIKDMSPSIITVLGQELTDGDDDEYRLAEYADNVVKTDKDTWNLPAVKRGDYFDDLFGNNLGHNFPVVDKLENRVLTSIKSMDLSLKSYQTSNGIFGKILKDASTLKNFTGKAWGDNVIIAAQYDSKVLYLILPDISITSEQMLGLQAAELYIKNQYNIQLLITVATN